eukprot:TRINITY_DN3926_c2_g1_i1.p1 TRINITY_DN3926_c2_g1~~TRINITY_DN3926_c2_g1_i1.p1  ORF type:complete len:554 (+),score=116.43 TRINITY_DN3926_c2_g1_i1:240-1664(+)
MRSDSGLLRPRRASFDGDVAMAPGGDVDLPAAPHQRRRTPPSRASTSAGDSEHGEADDEDERMALGGRTRPAMRCKRKRDCALTGVCDKFGGLQISDAGSQSAQQARGRLVARGASPSGMARRSKSILKKTHSGSRVRFARQGRATKDFVMFDEANIKEVQTCLAILSDVGPANEAPSSGIPGTPRSVVLFQQDQEDSAGDDGPEAPFASPRPALRPTANAAPPPPRVDWGTSDKMDSTGERSGGEHSQPAKRGPNFYKQRRGQARMQEIEEGKSFRQILRQKYAMEEDEGGRSPTCHFAMGRPTGQQGPQRGFSPTPAKPSQEGSPRGSDFSSSTPLSPLRQRQRVQPGPAGRAVAAAAAAAPSGAGGSPDAGTVAATAAVVAAVMEIRRRATLQQQQQPQQPQQLVPQPPAPTSTPFQFATPSQQPLGFNFTAGGNPFGAPPAAPGTFADPAAPLLPFGGFRAPSAGMPPSP